MDDISQRQHVLRQAATSSVILLELNELSPSLMHDFMAAGELPNFKRLHDSSQVFITDAEEKAPNLEPWIQWVTVHSGLPFSEHGVFHLGDGARLKAPQLWDLLSRAGHKVWICGSMNIRYDDKLNGAALPDPWTTGVPPYPSGAFDSYCRFVQRNVQEHTNDRLQLSAREYLDFLKFMVGHGLSVRTVAATLRQLLAERRNPKARWRRATILDRLQWDVFKHYYRTEKPKLATFFLNSTAHFQHMFWRNMDPEPFKVKPTEQENAEYRDAILQGYREMDRIVGDALSIAQDGRTVIMLASALSQQPCLTYEDAGGKTFYRPRDFKAFAEFAGVRGAFRIEPVMSEQFHMRFDDGDMAASAAVALRGLRVFGREAMAVTVEENSLLTGCCIFDQLSTDAVITRADGGVADFFGVFYQVEGLKSGMHHPDGILWIRIPGELPDTRATRASLRDIAPTVLGLLGVDAPAEMTGRQLT